jgi:hypothetical protein
LLCNGPKNTTTVYEQWFGKHVTKETNTHVTIVFLWKRGVFYVVRAEMILAGHFEVTKSVELEGRMRRHGAIIKLSVENQSGN